MPSKLPHHSGRAIPRNSFRMAVARKAYSLDALAGVRITTPHQRGIQATTSLAFSVGVLLYMRFGGLIAAIVLAAIAAVVVLRMSAKEPEPVAPVIGAPVQQEIKTTNVFVARQPIPIGTRITEEMLSQQPWPSHLLVKGFVTNESGVNVIGMVARSAFQQDEPLLMSKLSNPDDPNFLAGALPKGMRIITLQTNEVEGIGGFVFPGDFVDVILTHEVRSLGVSPTDGQPREERNSVTETLLTNVKVMAVDQRASGTGTTDGKGNLIIPRSVSLMVSPADAQRLRLAQQKGTVTLVLRSLADRESSDPLTVTGEDQITQRNPAEGPIANRVGVIVVRGVTIGKNDRPVSFPNYAPNPAVGITPRTGMTP